MILFSFSAFIIVNYAYGNKQVPLEITQLVVATAGNPLHLQDGTDILAYRTRSRGRKEKGDKYETWMLNNSGGAFFDWGMFFCREIDFGSDRT